MTKICECGEQGFIINSRQRGKYVARRYECKACKLRWTTIEFRIVNFDIRTKNLDSLLASHYSTVDKEIIADKLIELAQELLRT
jgi:transcriptional regulator NrdR family protein